MEIKIWKTSLKLASHTSGLKIDVKKNIEHIFNQFGLLKFGNTLYGRSCEHIPVPVFMPPQYTVQLVGEL